jgi:TetR/AcrR family transcriptional regulator
MAKGSDDPRISVPAQGREAILSVAKVQFAEQGYYGATLSTIAARARVSKANIFHHFSSKEKLYLAVLKDYCGQLSPLGDSRRLSAASYTEQRRQFAHIHLENMLNEREAVLLFLRELLVRESLRKEILAKRVLEDNFFQLVQMLHKKAGEIRCDIEPAILSVVLLGADVFFFMAEDIFVHF